MKKRITERWHPLNGTELKRHGYRWAPSQNAWSAFYNWNAKTLADKLTALATESTPNPA